MAKPCTPHPIPQAEQFFKPQTGNVGGRGGTPLVFLWGIQKGYSLRKENTPFGAAACGPRLNPRPVGAKKGASKEAPFSVALAIISKEVIEEIPGIGVVAVAAIAVPAVTIVAVVGLSLIHI